MKNLLLSTLFLCCGAILAIAPSTNAQITPDNTLGAERSRFNAGTAQQPIDRIDGGAKRGTNLFHSFGEFNINNGQKVYFVNPVGIQNIFTRVTGGKATNIFGTLGVEGTANLFLLNPNGILFGKNARLDVGGSFVASTASAIKFADGTQFSATTPQSTSLLTINVPIGLQFGVNPGRITVLGSGHNLTYDPYTAGTIRTDVPGLEVKPGKTLALVGGDIVLEGGNLRAESGRIELGSVASPGLVSLTQNDTGFSLGYSGIENFGDIQATNKASVDVSGDGGGFIQVQSRRLSLQDGSAILSISGAKPGGSFTVNASESVELIGQSADGQYASSLYTESQGSGASGDMRITTGKLTATDGAYVSTYITSSGNGGNLNVKASDAIELTGVGIFSSGFYTGTSLGSSGNSGDVTVETGRMSVKNGGIVFTSTAGKGNAGNITINTRDTVSFDNNGAVSNAVASGASGKAGDTRITTGVLSLTNKSVVSSNTAGIGDAGNIFIDTRDRVSLQDSFISSSVQKKGVGRGGKIQIRTEALSLTDGAFIDSSTNGQGDAGSILIDTGSLSMSGDISTSTTRSGNAGNITIHARDTISLDQGNIDSSVYDSGSDITGFAGIGRGGDINITTGSLQMTNRAALSASSSGLGNAGSISIAARDMVSLNNDSNVSTFVLSFNGSRAFGRAGDIQITTGSLFVTNNSVLLAGTDGQRDAGNVMLNARDRISFSNGGQLRTETLELGNAGNITIRTGYFSIDGVNPVGNQQRSGIFSIVDQTGVGRAGNINVAANSVSLTNGGIIDAATSGQGRAGDITITAGDRVSLTGTSPNGQYRSAITTETTNTSNSDAGNIILETKQLNINSGAIISAATSGQGRGGDITINTSDGISLFGLSSDGRFRSAITTETTNSSTGNAGYLTITTKKFSISSGAGIFATSLGKGTAGDMTITGSSLLLERGFISAETASTNGGNLTLQLKDTLVLRQGSQISTTAGTLQAGGNGGNITINAATIVAPGAENSDITANAYSGNGGNVRINTKGIFGIQARAQLTPQSDITASSQFGVTGQITINQPDVQPTQGLIQLPSQVLDASNQIGQVCPKGIAALRRLSEFIITGRGSLPPSPLEPMARTNNLPPLATLEDDSVGSLSSKQSSTQLGNFSAPMIPNQIVEATSWVKTADGSIELVAQIPQAIPHIATTTAACPFPTHQK